MKKHATFRVKNADAIDVNRRAIRFTISDGTLDRDGDIVSPSGWDLAHYAKNPVFLWAHDAEKPPIGRGENLQLKGDRLMGDAVFTPLGVNPFADMVFDLYRGGFLNAVSAGFEPVEFEPMRGEDMGMRFTKQRLQEFSAVPVPANPNALVSAKSAGVNLAPLKSWCEDALDTADPCMDRGVLTKTWKALGGGALRLSMATQDALARKNLEALRAKDNPTENIDHWALGFGGDPAHAHEMEPGALQTEAAEDGHVHAVSYDEDGRPVIEPAEDGHDHEAPPGAQIEAKGETMTDEELAKVAAKEGIEIVPEGEKTAEVGTPEEVIGAAKSMDPKGSGDMPPEVIGAAKTAAEAYLEAKSAEGGTPDAAEAVEIIAEAIGVELSEDQKAAAVAEIEDEVQKMADNEPNAEAFSGAVVAQAEEILGGAKSAPNASGDEPVDFIGEVKSGEVQSSNPNDPDYKVEDPQAQLKMDGETEEDKSSFPTPGSFAANLMDQTDDIRFPQPGSYADDIMTGQKPTPQFPTPGSFLDTRLHGDSNSQAHDALGQGLFPWQKSAEQEEAARKVGDMVGEISEHMKGRLKEMMGDDVQSKSGGDVIQDIVTAMESVTKPLVEAVVGSSLAPAQGAHQNRGPIPRQRPDPSAIAEPYGPAPYEMEFFPENSQKAARLKTNYEVFPWRAAKALADHWPELWKLGREAPTGEMLKGSRKALNYREAWATKNLEADTLGGVMSQVKRLVVGRKGLAHMRAIIAEGKKVVLAKRKADTNPKPRPKKKSAEPEIEVSADLLDEMIRQQTDEAFGLTRS